MRRRRKGLEVRANMQPENIFEAKNAARGQESHSLISLVYGVAFCLINTLVINYPYAAHEAAHSIRRGALHPISLPLTPHPHGWPSSSFARDTPDRY